MEEKTYSNFSPRLNISNLPHSILTYFLCNDNEA